jgi:glutamate-1-semialdehyde 2,1-aminomutase
MINLKNKINNIIPGGAHTYSRGRDQFSSDIPDVLERGKGAYVFRNGRKYLDYGMGLRSVNIGYSERDINQGAKDEIDKGNNLTLPSLTEFKAAKLFTNLVDSADMVKFTKNGSTAVTAAIKLARAYTNKNIILRCAQHSFFSYDDWFIGSTNIKRGIPKEFINLTKKFNYNDILDLKKKISLYKNKIAAVILEPATTCCPKVNFNNYCCSLANCTNNFKKKNFLKDVQDLCNENKILFIMDEMITGFRWHIKGAQFFYNVKPDLSTFGKAMANGFSVAALCGRKDIMDLGSINHKKQERVFLASTTFGAEMSSLGAFINTVKFIKKNNVIEKNFKYGEQFIKLFNLVSENFGLSEFVFAGGIACSPFYICKDKNKNLSLPFRTLLMQEMLKNKILFPSYISICFRHNEDSLRKTEIALIKSFHIYKKALKIGLENYLRGDSIKPVFRKYN